jgi:hypothetical protein
VVDLCAAPGSWSQVISTGMLILPAFELYCETTFIQKNMLFFFWDRVCFTKWAILELYGKCYCLQ